MTQHDENPLAGRTWRYSTWGGHKATVVADSVEFGPAHVIWRDTDGRTVLAEDNANVHEVSEVGHGGSATRGVRPGAPA